MLTVLGTVRVERPYYHCRHCHAGHSPLDTALGLSGGDLSTGASEAVDLAGALGSFAEAAEKTLPRLCGLRVSKSTVEGVSERMWAGGWRAGRRSAGRSSGGGREKRRGRRSGTCRPT